MGVSRSTGPAQRCLRFPQLTSRGCWPPGAGRGTPRAASRRQTTQRRGRPGAQLPRTRSASAAEARGRPASHGVRLGAAEGTRVPAPKCRPPPAFPSPSATAAPLWGAGGAWGGGGGCWETHSRMSAHLLHGGRTGVRAAGPLGFQIALSAAGPGCRLAPQGSHLPSQKWRLRSPPLTITANSRHPDMLFLTNRVTVQETAHKFEPLVTENAQRVQRGTPRPP